MFPPVLISDSSQKKKFVFFERGATFDKRNVDTRRVRGAGEGSGGWKPTIEQNATVQEGMFIHLMLRADPCLVEIKTRNNNTTKKRK